MPTDKEMIEDLREPASESGQLDTMVNQFMFADIIEQAFDAGNQWGMFRVSSPFLTSPRETQEKIKEVVKLITGNMTAPHAHMASLIEALKFYENRENTARISVGSMGHSDKYIEIDHGRTAHKALKEFKNHVVG